MIVPYPSVETPVEKTEDHRLLRALAHGDRDAGAELVRRSYAMIWRSLLRLCAGDEELASDLTQESFKRAWAALPSFDGRARFSTWMYRIAYTTFLNHRRKRVRVVELDDTTGRKLSSSDPGPDEVANRREQDRKLQHAVLALPDPLGELVTARYWGEIPVRELAALAGVSETAIRKRLKKALALLKDHLEVRS